MADAGRQDVTLSTLHEDLRAGFGDLKATLVAGFRSLPGRESSEEMVRLLREGNRLQEARFAQLDARIREQHLETQQVLHALAEGQRLLTSGVRTLTGDVQTLAAGVRTLTGEVQTLAGEVRTLAGEVRTLAGEVRTLASEVRTMAGQVRTLAAEVRDLAGDIKALIARLDALIKGRGNGGPVG